jgi:competence protein ComFC
VLKSLWKGLVEQLAAPGCVACDSPLEADESGFCAACEPLVERVLACAEPNLQAAFHYGGPIADAVWRLKYEGRSEVARALRGPLAECAARWLGSVDVVLPVPITRAKLRLRGYNQSALLAQQVARAIDLPFRPTWLTRTRAGPRQVGQGRALRLSTIRGAFQASPKVAGKSALVIDDVRTTGATLHEAERALREAGAKDVFALTLALADAARDEAR